MGCKKTPNYDNHLQSLQADEARNSEAINDFFLAGHRLPLPPAWRPVSAKPWSALSPTGTQHAVGPTCLPIGARGQGCGPLLGQIHSPPPPLPVALGTGSPALPESGVSARALHVQMPPPFRNLGEIPKGTFLRKSRPG